MEFNKLINELKAFNLPINQYAITSSGALAVRDIREAQDLDVLVNKKLWKKLVKKYNVAKDKPFKIGNIEFFSEYTFGDDSPPTVAEQIGNAEIIEGIPFVKLETIKFFKKQTTRKKDLNDLLLIENYENKKS